MRVPSLSLPAPNRIAVYITSLAALGAAVAPVVADMDVTSTVGVLGGLTALVGVVVTWLKGWQAHEARAAVPEDVEPGDVWPALEHLPTTPPSQVPHDQGDAGGAA